MQLPAALNRKLSEPQALLRLKAHLSATASRAMGCQGSKAQLPSHPEAPGISSEGLWVLGLKGLSLKALILKA